MNETAAPAALTSTSYLVLGLIEREGPSTPYELKRHVAATIGHFWTFPHALLYKEPPRLVELGLLTEAARGGRAAAAAVHDHRPRSRRDPGVAREAVAGIRPSCAMPACSSCSSRISGRPTTAGRWRSPSSRSIAPPSPATRTLGAPRAWSTARTGRCAPFEHWRGVTLPMGLLYERAAVEFWEGVATRGRGRWRRRRQVARGGRRRAARLERELARRTGRRVGRPASSCPRGLSAL